MTQVIVGKYLIEFDDFYMDVYDRRYTPPDRLLWLDINNGKIDWDHIAPGQEHIKEICNRILENKAFL